MSDTDVFAVGTPGTIRHDNGTDWSAMTIPTTQYLSGVWGISVTMCLPWANIMIIIMIIALKSGKWWGSISAPMAPLGLL